MRYGTAFAEFVEPVTDVCLRAIDRFAAGSRMPDLTEVWVRWDGKGWRLEPRLLSGLLSRDVEPVILMETTGVLYEDLLAGKHDSALRDLAAKADGLLVRRDQEPMSKGLRAPWFRHPLYVETFVHDSSVMRDEADVRLAYCTTSDVDDMATFYPGEACQVVGFDAFSRREGSKLPPEQAVKPVAELQRIAPGKPIWWFESGRSVGLAKRAAYLRSFEQVEGVDVACLWDMDVPDSPDDFSWVPAMARTFATMGAT